MPSPAESNGRDQSGRFAPGNKLGRGNPLARRAQKLRSAMFEAVSDRDVRQILAALVNAAKNGDTIAAREVLDRTIGKAAQTDVLQRLEALEQAIGANA